jgi:hypothetical protein
MWGIVRCLPLQTSALKIFSSRKQELHLFLHWLHSVDSQLRISLFFWENTVGIRRVQRRIWQLSYLHIHCSDNLSALCRQRDRQTGSGPPANRVTANTRQGSDTVPLTLYQGFNGNSPYHPPFRAHSKTTSYILGLSIFLENNKSWTENISLLKIFVQ